MTPPPTTPRSAAQAGYTAFLRTRWAARARLLALYALGGSAVLSAFDVLAMRVLEDAAPLGLIAAVRLPWTVIPVLGLVLPRLLGDDPARLRPATVALAAGWLWGNDAAYLALGLGGTALHAVFAAAAFTTAATFLPLTFRGRLAVFTLFGAGLVALDLAWPGGGGTRLLADAAVLAFAACALVVAENYARSQSRGLRLRRELEQLVIELEASRRRAADAAVAVGALAAGVAHEVNNPLAAVKVNVAWLAGQRGPPGPAGADHDPERAEVLADTVAAIERIGAIVARLRHQALAEEGVGEPPVEVRSPARKGAS